MSLKVTVFTLNVNELNFPITILVLLKLKSKTQLYGIFKKRLKQNDRS